MNKPVLSLSIALILSTFAGIGPGTAAAQSLSEVLQNGKTSAQLRLSYDTADVADNGTDAATDVSLRTRLGYRTADWSGLVVLLQFQDVTALVRTYAPVDPDYDTINDPEAATVHQAYVEIVSVPDSTIRAGRQEIRIENGRFLSESPWRQQGQSLDAVSLNNKSVQDLTIIAAAAQKVLTSSAAFLDLDHFALLDAQYAGVANNSLYAHAFYLDMPDGAPRSDSATYGVRATGDFAVAEYQADYNSQQKYGDATGGGGDMMGAFAALKFGEFRAGPGYTRISGASGKHHAFDTLFGTTHQFQGFANVFAGTNGGSVPNGIVETYLLVGGNHGAARWEVRHHVFKQETQDQAYGDENDGRVIYMVDENLTLSAEFALYTASSENESTLGTADKTVNTFRVDYKF